MENYRVRGQGFVFQRGEVWWIGFRQDGRLIRESAKTGDRDLALKYLAKCVKAAHKAEGAGVEFQTSKARKRMISDLVEALRKDFARREKDSPQNLSNLRRVTADFGHFRANALTADDVDDYIEQRQAAGDAAASINRTLQMLKQSLTFARIPEQSIPRIAHLSENNVRQGFFSEGQIRAVISYLPEHLQDFVLFGYLTGMRKSEIGSLAWADMDGAVLKLRAENAKNGEGRPLPIVGELAELIGRRRTARQVKIGDTVMLSGLIFHRQGLPIAEFRKSWATACRKAGVDGRLFHDLRRSAVRDLVRAGVPESVAMRISGHKTRTIFDRYNIASTRDLEQAFARRAEYLKTQVENVAVMPAAK
jgi:integrase